MSPKPILALTAALAVASCDLGSGPSPGELRILFIGNSLTYWNDLPGLLEDLIVSKETKPVTVASVAAGGWGLPDHWTDGIARERIAEGGWDFVILQQGPSATEGRPYLLEYAPRFAEEIRRVGGKPALYAVWPPSDRQYEFAAVSESYSLAAEAAGALLLPVGDAWLAAWEQDPTIRFYGADGFHPTPAATYLAALVMYKKLTGHSPVGLPAPEAAELTTEQVGVLQAAARQVK